MHVCIRVGRESGFVCSQKLYRLSNQLIWPRMLHQRQNHFILYTYLQTEEDKTHCMYVSGTKILYFQCSILLYSLVERPNCLQDSFLIKL